MDRITKTQLMSNSISNLRDNDQLLNILFTLVET